MDNESDDLDDEMNEVEEFYGIGSTLRALKQAPFVDGCYVLGERKLNQSARDDLIRDLEARADELVQKALDEGVRQGEFVRLPNGNYRPVVH
jgi:hypothetical protein